MQKVGRRGVVFGAQRRLWVVGRDTGWFGDLEECDFQLVGGLNKRLGLVEGCVEGKAGGVDWKTEPAIWEDLGKIRL